MNPEAIKQAIEAGADEIAIPIGGSVYPLVKISPGVFTMGSPADEAGRLPNEGPQRLVRISKTFYLGRYELTRGQSLAVMEGGQNVASHDDLAASQMTYADALRFCEKLSHEAGLAVGLPTEAQWEYACRAGTDTPTYAGSTAGELEGIAWYSGNAGGHVHPVGNKAPNPWGLYDMLGNLWEFCLDFVDDYAAMSDLDPVGTISGQRGAMRGGGWMHGPEYARAASRLISDDMFGGAGIRIAVIHETAAG